MLRLLLVLVLILSAEAAVRAEDFRLDEIAPGVFVHAPPVALVAKANGGDTANLGFIVGRSSVAVIDTGTTRAIGEALLASIRTRTNLPISHVITTHMHPDHTLGNAAFAAGGVTFAGHRNLPAALAARWESFTRRVAQELGEETGAGEAPVRYTLLVEDEARIDLGGRVLVLKAWPTAHTDNDLTIFDEATGTLFAGDLLFQKHLPVIDGSIRGWLAAMTELKELPAARAVPGHGLASVDWAAALAREERYLATLATDLRQAIKDGKRISEAPALSAQGERTAWDLFDDFHPRNATAAFEELEWE